MATTLAFPITDFSGSSEAPTPKEEFLENYRNNVYPELNFWFLFQPTYRYEGKIIESKEELTAHDWYARVNSPSATYTFTVSVRDGMVDGIQIIHNFMPQE